MFLSILTIISKATHKRTTNFFRTSVVKRFILILGYITDKLSYKVCIINDWKQIKIFKLILIPAHLFKFAVELQEKQSGNSPVLIRIETNAGHGAGTPVSKTIEQYADIFSFTLYNMGFREFNASVKN